LIAVTRRPAGVAHPRRPLRLLPLLWHCAWPPPRLLPPPSFRVSLLIEEGPRLNRGVGTRPRDPQPVCPRRVPPEALEPRAPDRAPAAPTASSGALPRGRASRGGQGGVRGRPLLTICIVFRGLRLPLPLHDPWAFHCALPPFSVFRQTSSIVRCGKNHFLFFGFFFLTPKNVIFLSLSSLFGLFKPMGKPMCELCVPKGDVLGPPLSDS